MTYLEMDIIFSRYFLFLKYGSHPMIAFVLTHPVDYTRGRQPIWNRITYRENDFGFAQELEKISIFHKRHD